MAGLRAKARLQYNRLHTGAGPSPWPTTGSSLTFRVTLVRTDPVSKLVQNDLNLAVIALNKKTESHGKTEKHGNMGA